MTVGDGALEIAAGARAAGLAAGAVHHVADARAATRQLLPLLRPGDTILVKGSHDVALETVVADLEIGRRAGGGAVNVLLVQGILLAFALVVILMPLYIRFLRYVGFGKRIRVDGPETHLVKEGTPTMGGLLIISVVGALALVLNLVDASTFAPLATIALVGVLGAVDDFLNVRTGDGHARPLQGGVAGGRGPHRRLQHPAHVPHHGPRGALHRRRRHPRLGLHRLRRLRHRGHLQRRQPDRRPRRAGRRDAHLRLRGLPHHRPRRTPRWCSPTWPS